MPIPQNPIISSISPNSGPQGTHVNITGLNLLGAYVTFNGVTATQLYNSSTSIIAVAPASTTGLVIAHNASGNSGGFTFTYTSLPAPTISFLSPSSGQAGINVIISGSNFGSAQNTSTVTFNGVSASVFSWSATSITVVVPTTATTGPVIVTVNGVASNSSTFVVTTPSNGGTSSPLGMLLIPADSFDGPVIYTLDPTNFNDPNSPSSYNYKVEDVIAGRTPTCNKVIVSYRDLGVATVTFTLSGVIGDTNSLNATKVVTSSETVTIGTAGASKKICTLTLGITLTAANLQLTCTRAANAGPMSITKVRLEGTVER